MQGEGSIDKKDEKVPQGASPEASSANPSTDQGGNAVPSGGAGTGGEGERKPLAGPLAQPDAPGDVLDSKEDPRRSDNPLRNLGDAQKKWEQKLAVVQDGEEVPDGGDEEGPGVEGGTEFEFATGKEERDGQQALAAATDEQITEQRLHAREEDEGHADAECQDGADLVDDDRDVSMRDDDSDVQASRGVQQVSGPGKSGIGQVDNEQMVHVDAEEAMLEKEDGVGLDSIQESLAYVEVDFDAENDELTEIRSGIERLLNGEVSIRSARDEENSAHDDAARGRELWQRCAAATAGLTGELVEQLRLVLEPTQASRLSGDYKTGKRLNMKKVIGYIASNFRQDKIWLRRTSPDKRQYQVVLAIDETKSMRV
jgi:midasin